ncbi:MAG: hypothetical protein U0793_11270 [Gemmataceae bacterium]
MANAHEKSPARSPDRQELRRYFDSVFKDINAVLAEQNDEKRDELREQLEPLCFMKLIEHKIQIAWGGPEYGFKLYFDPQCKEWTRGVFYWADWFKYEEEPLSSDELDQVVTAYSMDSLTE